MPYVLADVGTAMAAATRKSPCISHLFRGAGAEIMLDVVTCRRVLRVTRVRVILTRPLEETAISCQGLVMLEK